MAWMVSKARGRRWMRGSLALVYVAQFALWGRETKAQGQTAEDGKAAGVPATVSAPAAGQGQSAGPSAGTSAGTGSASGASAVLMQGQRLFEDQQYEESIQVLSGALLRPTLSKAEKRDLYKLLAFNFVTINRKDEAEGAVRALLVLEPSFELPRYESPRFRDAFAAIRARWEAEGQPGLAAVERAPITLSHLSPAEADGKVNLPITVRVTDPDKIVTEVRLYWRRGTNGRFEQASMAFDGAGARGQIPGAAVEGPILEYFIAALGTGGTTVATRGDAEVPLRVAVREKNRAWVWPVALGAGVLGAGAIVGALALAGVFQGSEPVNSPVSGPPRTVVNVSITE